MKKKWVCIFGGYGLITLALIQLFATSSYLIKTAIEVKPYNVVFLFVECTISAILGVQVYRLRKRTAQIERHEKESLERIHSYIGQVVHDLRSPASSISMLSEYLQDEMSGSNSESEYLQMIKAIQKSSNTMLERICCILDTTRMEKGIDHLELTNGNPYTIIQAAIDKHMIFAIDKNITIISDITNDLPLVYYEREALDSVISNLLSNAIKYSPINTTIRITSMVEKGKLSIFVKDQGLGMTNDDLKKVFGEFTKLSARPTGGESSSGLGLSVVKKLVTQMGGTVKAFSQGKNLGSTFSFELKTTAKIARITA
jgi:two-component system, sensor histidine kinase and response regulator